MLAFQNQFWILIIHTHTQRYSLARRRVCVCVCDTVSVSAWIKRYKRLQETKPLLWSKQKMHNNITINYENKAG